MESVLTTHFTKHLRALETQNSYELVTCICLVVLFVTTQASHYCVVQDDLELLILLLPPLKSYYRHILRSPK